VSENKQRGSFWIRPISHIFSLSLEVGGFRYAPVREGSFKRHTTLTG
jgi:hypothetical protein